MLLNKNLKKKLIIINQVTNKTFHIKSILFWFVVAGPVDLGAYSANPAVRTTGSGQLCVTDKWEKMRNWELARAYVLQQPVAA